MLLPTLFSLTAPPLTWPRPVSEGKGCVCVWGGAGAREGQRVRLSVCEREMVRERGAEWEGGGL